MPLKLLLLLVVGHTLTGCVSSNNAGCIAYFQNAKGVNSNDSDETIIGFVELQVAMEAACDK